MGEGTQVYLSRHGAKAFSGFEIRLFRVKKSL